MQLAKRDRGFLTLLRNRNFMYLWLAQVISMTVFNASNFVLLALITNITDSSTATGVAVICFSLPAVIFGAPAGVFVDHMNKHRVLWGSNCLRALATVLFVGVLMTNQGGWLLVLIYLLTFLISSIGQFFAPAEGSAIPMLVREEELMPALSLFNITFMLSQAIGYIAAPLIIIFLPVLHLGKLTFGQYEIFYSALAILYLVSAVLVALIPRSSLVRKSSRKTGAITTQTLSVMDNVWREMLQGWSFVRSNKQLFLAVVELSFAGTFMYIIVTLAPTIMKNMLSLNTNAMPLIFAPAGVGLVVGSIFMPRISRRLGRARTIFIGIFALAGVTLLFPITVWLAGLLQPQGWNTNPLLLVLIALYMLIAGFGLDFVNIPSQTTMQELSPSWIKGRVLALQIAFFNLCSIPIILFIGAITDFMGIDTLLFALTGCIIAFGLWCIYYTRKHHLKDPEQKAEKPAEEQELNTAGAR